MPSNRKVTQVDPTSEDLQEYVDSGRYWFLFGILSGTTASGQSVSLGDIADHVIVERNGTQLLNVPASFLHKIVDEWFGTVELTNPSGGDTRIGVPIPFYYPERENNVLNVRSDQELEVNIQFNQSTLSSRFDGTPSFELRKYTASGISEQYQPRYKTKREPLQAGDTGVQVNFNESGIVRLYIDDQGSGITNVSAEIDNRVLVSNGTLDSVNDLANLLNRVESSPDDLVEINPFQGPPPQGKSQQKANLQLDADAQTNVKTYRIVERAPLN
jgi:hypothetical protein